MQQKYNIEQNFIPGLPKTFYDDGHYIGVVAHATGIYNDTPESERNVEVNEWQKAFVHFFVGSGKILQVADTNYICYGAGHTANHLGYAQVELDQTNDEKQFIQDYEMYTWLIAKLLSDRNLRIIDGVTLMSHDQVSKKWHESDHTDPIDYLASHGKSWDDVINDVTKLYQGDDDVLKIAILKFTSEDEWAAKDIDAKLGGVANFTRQGTNGTIPADAMDAQKLITIGGSATGHANELLLSGKDKYETAQKVAAYLNG